MSIIRDTLGRLSASSISMLSMAAVAVVVAVTVLFVYSPAGNGATVGLQLVAQGFNSPVHLESSPDGSGRRFIVDRIGTVHVLTPDGRLLDEPFLDVRARLSALSGNYDERGLLGFTFHPHFAVNRRIFAHYSAPLRPDAPTGWDHTGRIVEFTVSASDPDRVDVTSERVILEIDQPRSNHNGGTVAFGPDGYLYVGLGDGGGGNDVGVGHPPLGNGQDVTTLLGSVLRIDVDPDPGESARPYAVPADNPFADGGGRPEIYAWGFRNAYRFSFDRGGEGHLFVADVGQNLWEEVNLVTGPGNFGWRIKEGSFWFDPDRPDAVLTEGPNTGPSGEALIDPIIQYAHPGKIRTSARVDADALAPDPDLMPQFGISVIGGYVYRGQALPEWHGQYVFGDWSTSFGRGAGKLLLATPPAAGDGAWAVRQALEVDRFVLGFGEDADGELYVLTTDRTGPVGTTGKVYKLVPAAE